MLFRSLLSLALLLTFASCGQASPSDPGPRAVANGTWGTARALLTVESSGARLELDCGYAEVTGALTLDDAGRFDKMGTFVREHGGPIVQNEPLDSHPARFSGSVTGRKLTLKVTPTDGVEGPGTFELTLGEPAQLVKCR